MSDTEIKGWGGTSVVGTELCPVHLDRVEAGVPIARGLGRSYGDASLPPAQRPTALCTVRADRILGFETLEDGAPETRRDHNYGAVLRAEAGLSLADLHRTFLYRGYTVPVSPGTQFVTLGGMVAADVHGKNHHVDGCIGPHVRELVLKVASGDSVRCSPSEHPDLFAATVGGMGLTGHILEVEMYLKKIPSPWIYTESRRVPHLDAFLDALEDAKSTWPYTVGWIDCLTQGRSMGRGLLMAGRWANASEAPQRLPRFKEGPSIPFNAPNALLSKPTVRAFNALYYRKQLRTVSSGIVSPYSFFYPLDAVRHWNRLYGSKGFTQYQCVIPTEAGREPVRNVMRTLTQSGLASFLSVIKDCGLEGVGTLSFPRPGVSIALDIPMRRKTQALTDALNRVVKEAGGRIYLAKDALTRREDYEAMESERLETFRKIRDKWDPSRAFCSAQSVRLLGDDPRQLKAKNAAEKQPGALPRPSFSGAAS